MADLNELIAQLQDASVEVQATAAEQLAQMGESAQRAATHLVRATGSAESVSTHAVAALEELGVPDPDTVPALTKLIGDAHELVAYWAVTLLGRLESDAGAAEESLVAVLDNSPHLSVRQRAAWALGRIGALSPATTDSLQKASVGSDRRLAQLAERALASSKN